MRRIHIIGRKNSGKTTLIVELVREFSGRGLHVGTIKHTHHRHELDTPGKDSFQHREAGAAAVGILSPGMDAVFLPRDARQPTDADRYEMFATMFSGCHIVLVEGDSQADAPKFEVWRQAAAEAPMAVSDRSITAVITDDSVESPCPVWPRSDVTLIATRILEFVDS